MKSRTRRKQAEGAVEIAEGGHQTDAQKEELPGETRVRFQYTTEIRQ